MQITFPQTITYTCALISNKSRTTFVSVSAMLVYIHKKNIAQVLFLSDIFFFHLSGSKSWYLLNGVPGGSVAALFITSDIYIQRS